MFNLVPWLDIVFVDKTHSDEKRAKDLGNNPIII